MSVCPEMSVIPIVASNELTPLPTHFSESNFEHSLSSWSSPAPQYDFTYQSPGPTAPSVCGTSAVPTASVYTVASQSMGPYDAILPVSSCGHNHDYLAYNAVYYAPEFNAMSQQDLMRSYPEGLTNLTDINSFSENMMYISPAAAESSSSSRIPAPKTLENLGRQGSPKPKPFPCIHCLRRFSRKGDLHRHAQTQHNGIAYGKNGKLVEPIRKNCPFPGCLVHSRIDNLPKHVQAKHQQLWKHSKEFLHPHSAWYQKCHEIVRTPTRP